MVNNFSRKILLLRKERGLSQKQAAQDLSVTQALLSHYEKGKRECGLSFLVRIADYYNVSTDYLLGRSGLPSGQKLDSEDIIMSDEWDKNKFGLSDLTIQLNKKLISNSLDVIFSLLIKTKNSDFIKAVCSILNYSVYKCFRIIFNSNRNNDENLLSLPAQGINEAINAGISLSERKAALASSNNTDESVLITNPILQREYPKSALSLMNLMHNCETELKKII